MKLWTNERKRKERKESEPLYVVVADYGRTCTETRYRTEAEARAEFGRLVKSSGAGFVGIIYNNEWTETHNK